MEPTPHAEYLRPLPVFDRSPFGWRMFWDVTVLQSKKPMVGVWWPIILALVWALHEGVLTWLSAVLVTGDASVGNHSRPELDAATGILVYLGLGVATWSVPAIVALFVVGATYRALVADGWTVTGKQIWPRLGALIVATTLKAFFISAASVCLIFPAAWLAGRLYYVQLLIVHRGLGVVDAFAESWRMSSRIQWMLAANLFVFAFIFLILVSALAVAFEPFALEHLLVAGILGAVCGTDIAMTQATTYKLLVEREELESRNAVAARPVIQPGEPVG